MKHKDCKYYADCDWVKNIGYCPDECNSFKHKDEVLVVRCQDCKFSKYFVEYGSRKCRTMNGLFRTVEDDNFCSYGERKANERT